jgi:hypothetical protein
VLTDTILSPTNERSKNDTRRIQGLCGSPPKNLSRRGSCKTNNTKGKLIMGYIEIFRINEEGAGWVDLSEATPEEMLDLEIGLFQEGAL